MNNQKKYEMLDQQPIHVFGDELYQIRALIDIPEHNVRAGDLGGFIAKEENLSHEGTCWVADNAKVFYDAQVFDDAVVYDNAMVFGTAKVFGFARIAGDSYVSDRAQVFDHAELFDNTWIKEDAHVYGNTFLRGNMTIGKSADISDSSDVLYITPIGSDEDSLLFYKSGKESVRVNINGDNKLCYYVHTLNEFEKFINDNFAGKDDYLEYSNALKLAISKFCKKYQTIKKKGYVL